MTKKFRLFVVIFVLLLSTKAQIKIKELPVENLDSYSLDILTQNNFRHTKMLSDQWQVFLPESETIKTTVKVPFSFDGLSEIILKKELLFSKEDISKNHYRLVFLGINYSSEIYLNDQVLFKSPVGNIPFLVDIPKSMLTPETNTLSIKVFHKLDSDITIPLLQSFQAPVNKGGVVCPVFLQTLPKINISKLTVSTKLENKSRAKVKVKINLSKNDNLKISSKLSIDFEIYDRENNFIKKVEVNDLSFSNKDEISTETNIIIDNPKLWTPDTPHFYKVTAKLKNSEHTLDKAQVSTQVSDFSFNKFFRLNGNKILLKGVTYIPTLSKFGPLISSKQIKEDLIRIKNTGFNAVRFSRSIPNPIALEFCKHIGLISFIEIPINSAPESMTIESTFIERTKRYTDFLLESTKIFAKANAIGVGSTYLANSEPHRNLISILAKKIKSTTNTLTFASFSSLPQDIPNSLDLAGVEVYNPPIEKIESFISTLKNSNLKNKIFISEATYPIFNGNTNGFKNNNSFEAQAKFFNDLINLSLKEKIPAFFINTMFDYKSEFVPLTTGYNKESIVKIGLIGIDRKSKRLAFKVVQAKLNKEEKTTIPMGHKKDDAPLMFILIGLGLALMIAVLFNSKRKFREEATRALLRPYNFYADIRDQRILSGFHSNFLMIILSSSLSLLVCNILFFFRANIFLERILLSFGNYTLVKTISYLAWNPLTAFVYLFFTSVLLILILSLLIRATSFFVKTKVIFSSVYYTVTWAFLPLALILPLELVLYRILSANLFNQYIYGFLVIFVLWLIQRIIKGIYVIFDVRAAKVYFLSIIFILLVIVGFLFYFQFTDSTIYYLLNSYKIFTSI